MAGEAVLTLYFILACCIAVAVGTSLRDIFYNEIRNILARPRFPNELEDGPPRPEEVVGWPNEELKVGQVSGVAVNNVGQPVIFHRGNRLWDSKTFDDENRYLHEEDGPILGDTILILDPADGKVLRSWGGNFFYLPHGIAIDHEGNTWLTDVAMHQVFKFSPRSVRPSLTLGKRFEPGKGELHFCKPSSVAIASSGEVFVADGYCNSRILKYDSAGRLLRVFPQKHEFLSLEVPHGLALLEERDLLCVADRENMRVACLCANLHRAPCSTPFTIQQPDMGRVFAIAPYGDYVYAVNGPTSPLIPVRGFTLHPLAETIIDHWGPSKGVLSNPHSIAVSPDGRALYISEIGPNKVWKFNLKNSKKIEKSEEMA
ncbi:peptidyl-alpha-hydroxyglycine alpha-amidating lyase 2-like [Lycorma delicatula]|uniref:peptidyl-alpha-hydroxyglycine alpha-amidating lyase 2-like n=1 Tax=Lycorma delicatula TaxID=130591 RepID=UPI003F5180D2